MGFEPQQNPTGLETINEFMKRMRTAIKEAKSTICKAQDNMKRYYNYRRTPAPVFNPGNKVSALELTAEFHHKHPGAPKHIWRMEFDNIFHSKSIAPRHSNLEGGVNVRRYLYFHP